MYPPVGTIKVPEAKLCTLFGTEYVPNSLFGCILSSLRPSACLFKFALIAVRRHLGLGAYVARASIREKKANWFVVGLCDTTFALVLSALRVPVNGFVGFLL